jgi:hypothetical protein
MSLTKRGGYHAHAERWGRKSAWNHPTPTRTIRVPEGLAEQILEYAHKLDNGEVSNSVAQAKDEEFWRAVLALFDRYIEEESQRDRKGNQYGKEFKTEGARWDRFNKFREWVKAKISAQVGEGDSGE